MSIVLCLQNLPQIFWTIIIALNLYVLFLLYRVSRLYRAERATKLEVTENLKNDIEFMRSQYIRPEFGTGTMSPPPPPPATAHRKSNNNCNSNNNNSHCDQFDAPRLRRRPRSLHTATTTWDPVRCSANERAISTPIATYRADYSFTNNSSIPLSPDDQHTLYISDSYGRVIHEIPFRERDYVDALYSVLGERPGEQK